MSKFNLHIGAYNSKKSQIPSGLDIDARNYIEVARFTNIDLMWIINQFYLDVKATGCYPKIKHMKLYITDSAINSVGLQQCGVNAIHQNSGFTSYSSNPTANYSGVSYNGINQYGFLGYYPGFDSDLSINSTSLLAYAYCSGVAYLSWAQRQGGNGNIGLTSVNNGVVQNFINDQASIVTFSGISDASGFIGASRNGVPGTKHIFRNNMSITQTGTFVTSRAMIDLFDGCRTLDGYTPANYYNMRTQFVAVGQGLSVFEVSLLEPIINNLQGSIDALFGLTGVNARKRY